MKVKNLFKSNRYSQPISRESKVVFLILILITLLPSLVFSIMRMNLNSKELPSEVLYAYEDAIKTRKKDEQSAVEKSTKEDKTADSLKESVGIEKSLDYYPILNRTNLNNDFLAYGVENVGYQIPYQTNLEINVNNSFSTANAGQQFWDRQTNEEFNQIKDNIDLKGDSKNIKDEITNLVESGSSQNKPSE